MPDPWKDAAKAYQVHTGATGGGGATAENEGVSNPPNGGAVTSVDEPSADYQIWNASDPEQERFSTELMKEIPYAAGQIGMGALKGVGQTADAIGRVLYPNFIAKHFTGATTDQQNEKPFASANPFQSFGKGAEQAGEFLAPGLGEEAATADIAKAAPKMAPLARIGYNALTSGLVNKAQGGEFGTGAMAGAGAGVVGEGMKALAPHMAESALNIRKLDRAYGKGNGAIGRAILDETSGVRPGTVAASAQNRLDELNPRLEKIADEASVRPATPVRGFLPLPQVEIPLGDVPESMIDAPGQLVSASRMPGKNIVGGLPDPRNIEQLGMDRATLPPARLTRSAYTTGTDDEINDLNRSGPGVLLRRVGEGQPPPEIPTMQPNRIASMRPGRNVISSAMGKAARQGERTTAAQLEPMARHLSETMSGEPIAADVTPRQLLDLNRGFGNEFVHRWNPETMQGVKGTAANVYHANSEEFKRVVPEARDLMRRQSLLIPVAKRGESAELNAPTAQRIAGRVAAHTGALTGGVFGAGAGYRRDGLPGAVAGGLMGVAAPELLASPTGQMIAARTFNSGSKYIPRLMAGTGLQLDRKPKEK